MKFLTFSETIIKRILKGDLKAFLNYKYLSRWKLSLSPGHDSLVDEMPWLTFPAIDCLNKKINNETRVFEWGGGGSTLFFLQKASLVVTVEHDKEWFDKLTAAITNKPGKKWSGHLILPEKGTFSEKLSISNPDDYYSDDAKFKKDTFRNYVSYIDQFADEYFDIILIDGRARTSCLKHAINKLKIGGYLVLDNAERSYYRQKTKGLIAKRFEIILDNFAAVPFITWFSQTIIWKKIK